MEGNYFNQLQKKVEDGKLTIQEAVEKSAVFIQKNCKMFALDTHDDDFKSSIILEFLQRGHTIFERYDKDFGQFFTYLYSFVKGLMLTESKRRAKQKIADKVNVIHSLESFFEMEERNDFTLVLEDSMQVPYAYKPLTKPLLEKTLKEYMAKRQYKQFSKPIIILALKASNDITGEEIDLICEEYNLNKDDFYKTVQNLKDGLESKQSKKDTVITSRNRAYFNHMKYSEPFAGNSLSTDFIRHEYESKFHINTRKWNFINNMLLNGLYHLCPTNEAIGKALGISTRQVCYYIKIFKDELAKIKRKKIETFKNSYYDS